MISIGAVYHGPELRSSQINAVIVDAGKELNELRGPLKTGETPWMNAVFVVSGSLGTLCINRSPTRIPGLKRSAALQILAIAGLWLWCCALHLAPIRGAPSATD